jgi:hypothetical protein
LIWYQAGDDSIGEGNVHGTILNAITPVKKNHFILEYTVCGWECANGACVDCKQYA